MDSNTPTKDSPAPHISGHLIFTAMELDSAYKVGKQEGLFLGRIMGTVVGIGLGLIIATVTFVIMYGPR